MEGGALAGIELCWWSDCFPHEAFRKGVWKGADVLALSKDFASSSVGDGKGACSTLSFDTYDMMTVSQIFPLCDYTYTNTPART